MTLVREVLLNVKHRTPEANTTRPHYYSQRKSKPAVPAAPLTHRRQAGAWLWLVPQVCPPSYMRLHGRGGPELGWSHRGIPDGDGGGHGHLMHRNGAWGLAGPQARHGEGQ